MTRALTRREFLRTSAAMAGSLAIPLTPATRAQTPEEMALSVTSPSAFDLADIGQRALEAASAAGAAYSDVRITTGLFLTWEGGPRSVCSVNPNDRVAEVGQCLLYRVARFGVRAFVDGHLGFAGNNLSTNLDQVADLANVAVGRARALAAAGSTGAELAPAPVVESGFYETPVRRDPFAVPLGEHEDYYLEAMQAMRDFPTESLMFVFLDTEWSRNDELFMSSEGSLTRQRVSLGNHFALMRARVAYNTFSSINMPTKGIYGSGGWELMDGLGSKLLGMCERAESLTTGLGTKPAEPGAYDVVFAPSSAAMLIAQTIGQPLEADRVLRRAAASKGYLTSYVNSANEELGQFRLGSENLNIRADRTRPGLGATVGFDSDGVETGEYSLVEKGIVTDYVTDRSFAPEFAEGYAPMERDALSNGCSSDTGGRRPRVKVPNLALLPGTEDLSQDDLVAQVERGYFVESMFINPDHASRNVQATGNFVREIRDGELGDLVLNTAMPFSTTRFWGNLEAVGGPSSVGENYPEVDDRDWEIMSHITVTTPPILVNNVFVVNASRRQQLSRGGRPGETGNPQGGNQPRGGRD